MALEEAHAAPQQRMRKTHILSTDRLMSTTGVGSREDSLLEGAIRTAGTLSQCFSPPRSPAGLRATRRLRTQPKTGGA